MRLPADASTWAGLQTRHVMAEFERVKPGHDDLHLST
jgi:hypothetical protein